MQAEYLYQFYINKFKYQNMITGSYQRGTFYDQLQNQSFLIANFEEKQKVFVGEMEHMSNKMQFLTQDLLLIQKYFFELLSHQMDIEKEKLFIRSRTFCRRPSTAYR